MTPTSEEIGTLFQLEERCNAGDEEARRYACIAAEAVTAAPESDWLDALLTLREVQRERRRELKPGAKWLTDSEWAAIADAADWSLYAEIDLAIDRQLET